MTFIQRTNPLAVQFKGGPTKEIYTEYGILYPSDEGGRVERSTWTFDPEQIVRELSRREGYRIEEVARLNDRNEPIPPRYSEPLRIAERHTQYSTGRWSALEVSELDRRNEAQLKHEGVEHRA